MKRLFHSAISLVLVAAMNLFVLGAHSSAMAMSSSHSMTGMKHAKTSVNCITLCASATSNKLNDLEVIDEEDNEEPSEPFYVAYRQPLAALATYHSHIARYAVKFEPPPGVPVYIRLAVFRA